MTTIYTFEVLSVIEVKAESQSVAESLLPQYEEHPEQAYTLVDEQITYQDQREEA
jgi:hypothetical protein